MTPYTIVFDLETGGLLPSHPTIQIGAVAVNATWNEVAAFEQKIAFDESSCDPKALAMNGYQADAWAQAVTPDRAAIAFAQFVRPYQCVRMASRDGMPYCVAALAGYNALTFDFPRLQALFSGRFMPCRYQVRDVLQRALWYFDERDDAPDNFGLSSVARALGLEVSVAHDALVDARLTAAVYRAIQERT